MAVRWTREGLFAVALGGVLAACGGRAQFDARASASTYGSTGGGGTSLPDAAAGSTPVPDAAAGMSSRLPPVCPAATVDASCPTANILIDLHAPTDIGSGLYAEPLQVPDYGTRPNNYFPHYDLPDPSFWDRSPLPAGACVFRVHGMGANAPAFNVYDPGGALVVKRAAGDKVASNAFPAQKKGTYTVVVYDASAESAATSRSPRVRTRAAR